MPRHSKKWWEDFNVPFAPTVGQINEDPIMAGACVVLAATYDVPPEAIELGLPPKVPGLVFRFVGADGQFMKPVMLLLDAEHLAEFKPVVCEAIDAAIGAAAL